MPSPLMKIDQKYDPRHLLHDGYTTKDPGFSSTASAFGGSSLRSLHSSQSGRAGSTLPSAKGSYRGEVRVWQHQTTEVNPSSRPPFLSDAGRWLPDKVPGMVVASQNQMLTAPGAYTAQGTLRDSIAVEGPKAIAAVHSYNDVSPAVNTECGHEAHAWATRTGMAWDPTVQKLRTARLHADEDIQAGALPEGDLMMATSRGSRGSAVLQDPPTPPTIASLRGPEGHATIPGSRMAPGALTGDAARTASVGKFWKRMEASSSGFNLSQRDLVRSGDTDLATRLAPGSNNCRLVGGRWRYVERPLAGTPLYTDYYGRYEEQSGNYYGRSWTYIPQ